MIRAVGNAVCYLSFAENIGTNREFTRIINEPDPWDTTNEAIHRPNSPLYSFRVRRDREDEFAAQIRIGIHGCITIVRQRERGTPRRIEVSMKSPI